MLVDQLGNQPGQVLGRQPVIQRRRNNPDRATAMLSTGRISASRNARLRSVQELLRTIHHRAHQRPIIPRALS